MFRMLWIICTLHRHMCPHEYWVKWILKMYERTENRQRISLFLLSHLASDTIHTMWFDRCVYDILFFFFISTRWVVCKWNDILAIKSTASHFTYKTHTHMFCRCYFNTPLRWNNNIMHDCIFMPFSRLKSVKNDDVFSEQVFSPFFWLAIYFASSFNFF